MEDYYLLCAAIPNAHIHASFWSFVQHLRDENGRMTWNEDQSWKGRLAVSTAHSIMPLVLKTQDEYFDLGMSDEIKQREGDWHHLWAPTNATPTSTAKG